MSLYFLSDIQTYSKKNAYESGKDMLDMSLDHIRSVFNEMRGGSIFHCGDLFEYSVPQEISRIKFIELFNEFNDVTFYTVSGNHDLHKRIRYGQDADVSVLNTIQEACGNFHILDITSPEYIQSKKLLKDGYTIYGLPYFAVEKDFHKAVQDISSQLKDSEEAVLMMHQDIDTEIPNSTISPLDDVFTNFKFVLNGHIHHRSNPSRNFYVLGSLQELKGNDFMSPEKGYWKLDRAKAGTSLDREFEFCPRTSYPKFVSYYVGEEVSSEDLGSLVLRKQLPSVKTELKEDMPFLTEKQIDDTTDSGKADIVKEYCKAKGVSEQVSSLVIGDLSGIENNVSSVKRTISYKSVTVEGYRSYANPITIPLNNNKLTMVVGANGSGKSTPFRAMYWCESGKSYVGSVNKKDIVTEPWMQSLASEWKGTRVMLEVQVDDVTFVLARHIAYKGDTFGHKGGDSFLVFEKSGSSYNLVDLENKLLEVYGEVVDASKKDGKVRDTELWQHYKGIKHDLFLNSIMFDSNKVRSILSSSSEKSNMLLPILDVKWTVDLQDLNSKKLTVLKSNQADISKDIQVLKMSYERELGRRDVLEAELNKNKSTQKNKTLELTQLRDSKLKDIESKNLSRDSLSRDLDAAVSMYNKAYEDYQEVEQVSKKMFGDDISKLSSDIDSLSSRIDQSSRDIYFLEQDLKSSLSNSKAYYSEIQVCRTNIETLTDQLNSPKDVICSSCGTNLGPEQKSDHLNNEIDLNKANISELEAKITKSDLLSDKLKLDISNLKKGLQDTQNELESMRNKRSSKKDEMSKFTSDTSSNYRKLSQLKDSAKYNLDSCEYEISKLKTDLSYVVEQLESYSSKNFLQPTLDGINSSEEKLEQLKRSIQEKESDLSPVEAEISQRKSINTKVLHSKGLRAYAINNRLGKLTECAKKYCDRLNTDIVFYLDGSFNYMAKMDIDGQYRNVHKLSDGQLTLANLVWVFSLNDLLKEKINCDFIFLDEPYTNLDPENSGKITDIMTLKSISSNLYLITHSARTNSTNTDLIQVWDGKLSPTRVEVQN